MARMIKTIKSVNLWAKLSTVHEDSTSTERKYTIGDIVENLRYVSDGEVVVVSGRITDITYTPARKLAWDKNNPTNAIATDMTLDSLVLDTSTQYNASSTTVPFKEIVEFDGEENVVRMKYEPFFVCDLELHYSDYKVQKCNIEAGDTFDNVRILDLANIGTDITGKFEVIGFAYALATGKINVTGIAFKNVDTGNSVVADFDKILALNEVYSHDITTPEAIADVLAALATGDTIVISQSVDTTGKGIVITKENITLAMEEDIITDGSSSAGVRVAGGSVTLTGSGKIVNTTPYASGKASGVVGVQKDGQITFDGSGISAVIEDDPVNKGQFGVCVYENGKVTINDGEFEAGWYCVSGNGSKTDANSVVEINGGELKSVADYAIYHPQPGKLVINGGKISGAAGAIAANNGTIEINGGEFSVLGGGNTGEWGDGTSGLQDVAINLNAKYGDIVCRITGGTFHATAAGTIMIQTGSTHNVDLQITGGKFTSKPNDEWIPEGYLCTGEPDEDGFYSVYKALY